MNTQDLINALKAKHSLKSDYEVAKFLNVSKQSIYNYRDGRECDDKTAILLAEKLDFNPARVLLEIQAHRTKNPLTKEVFLKTAESLPLEMNNKNNGLKRSA